MSTVILAGVETPRIGLGCMGMSAFYGACDRATALSALDVAYELGYRHFDTAAMYGGGDNEQILGEFISRNRSRRDSILIATKVGIRLVSGDRPSIVVDSSPKHVTEEVNRSLERLKVDCIDLLYLHRRSPAVPIEDTVGAMQELVNAGKVRALGLSEVSVTTLQRACTAGRITAVQSEYSLWSRDVERGLLQACADREVAFVAYSPLGRGFLAGAVNRDTLAREPSDLRGRLPRFQPANLEANEGLLHALQEMARDLGCEKSQVALAWVLARAPYAHVVPGSTKRRNLDLNMRSLEVSLSSRQIEELESVFQPEAIHGARYTDELMQTVNT